MKLHEDYLSREILDKLKDKGILEEKYKSLDILEHLTEREGYKLAEKIAKDKCIEVDISFVFGTLYVKIEDEDEDEEDLIDDVSDLIKFFIQCSLWEVQDEQFLVGVLKELDEDVLKELVKLYPVE